MSFTNTLRDANGGCIITHLCLARTVQNRRRIKRDSGSTCASDRDQYPCNT